MKIPLVDFIKSDYCLLAKYMIGPNNLYDLSGGNPCKECSYRKNCPTRPKLESRQNRTNRSNKNRYPLTNKQIADLLNVSKRQVAKLRKSGELDNEITKAKVAQ